MPPPFTLIGHEKQRAQLLQDIESENIAHAYLIVGKSQLGKMPLAKWFAGLLLSQDIPEEEMADHVRRIQKNIHPDLLVLSQLWIDSVCTDWNVIARSSNAPQQHRAKAKVKSDTIGIDDVRAIQDRMIETAARGRKCCIIRSIERLHITAANALLKILEEPPPKAVFICTTESLNTLPETIVSRMRVIKLHDVPLQKMEEITSELSQEDASLILEFAQGAPGVARACVDNPDTLRFYKQMNITAKLFLETESSVERLKILSDLFENRQQDIFLRAVLINLQKKLRSPKSESILHAKKQIDLLHTFCRQIKSNAQKQLLLRTLTLEFASLS